MFQLIPAQQSYVVLEPSDILSLEDAGVPNGAFAMRELDKGHLEMLALSDPRKWPHVLVTLCKSGYILIDGYHRWEIAKRHDWELKATCKTFTDECEVVEAAFQANLKHGLKASAQTRGDYAYWLHLTYPKMEQTEIAARAGITQGAVSKAIAKREEAAKQAEQESDPQAEREAKIRQNCKRFTKMTLRFLNEVEEMSDDDLLDMLASVVQRSGDEVKLQRMARLFENMKLR